MKGSIGTATGIEREARPVKHGPRWAQLKARIDQLAADGKMSPREHQYKLKLLNKHFR